MGGVNDSALASAALHLESMTLSCAGCSQVGEHWDGNEESFSRLHAKLLGGQHRVKALLSLLQENEDLENV